MEIKNGNGYFVVNIFNLHIEEFNDYLYIGRGEEAIASNSVARIRSFTFPNQIVVDGPKMWILFYTNDIGTQPGFFLQVEVKEKKGKCFFFYSFNTPYKLCLQSSYSYNHLLLSA